MIWRDWRSLDETAQRSSRMEEQLTEIIPINNKFKSSKKYPAIDSDALNYNRCCKTFLFPIQFVNSAF